MASLMENLLDTLEKELSEYRGLLELSMQKTSILIKGDVAALQKLTDEEEVMVDRVGALDRKREEYMKDVANVLNKDVNTLKLHQIVEVLQGRENEQTRLQKVHDALFEVTRSISRVNEQNRALIKQQLELVEFDMNLIRSMHSAPETAEYGRDAMAGGYGMPGAAPGSFDAKQ